MVELGRLTGLSASFLSQLETGRVVPTIRNLARIAIVFEKDLSCFFKQERHVTFRRLARKDRIPITRKQKQAAKFVSRVSVRSSRTVTSSRASPSSIPTGRRSSSHQKIFHGMEFVYVLQGNLEIAVSNQRQLLDTGDVVWIDAGTPRQYLCHGEAKAKALIVTQHRT